MSEVAFGLQVSWLVFGVQVDAVKQPTMRDPVSSGHVSHSRASAFHNDNFDHRFTVLKKM